ncbi:ADP-ribosyltransferase domain-containing protein, partial [Nocardia sp. NPDC047648]|uniref:ADP-ribosyltransferase domain-containing protein n=1 Tax=Nocardia sp. NPDC047648 TaxID=3155625 RepID=UPI0033CEA16D
VGPPKKDPVELPKIEHPEGIPKVDLPRADIDAIGRYTGDSAPLNTAIRSGDNLTPAQIAERDAMNAALDKCPVYEGPVTRRVELSSEDLARYEPGSTVTEAPFTSASASSAAAKDRPVEMQIWSADGRYIGHHSSVPEELEVVFKSDTPFRVVDKFPDPETGRIIIQMRELPRS